MNNLKKRNHRNLINFFTVLISISIFFIVNISFYYGGISDGSLYSHIMVLLTYILVFIVWNSNFSESIVDPINLLLYVQFIFLGSNSILKILRIESKDYFSGYPLSDSDFNLTNVLIILGIIFFLFGAIVGRMKKENLRSKAPRIFFKNSHFEGSGMLLFILGIIALLIDFDITWLYSAYRGFGARTVWKVLWTMFIPVSGFLLIASNKKKFIKFGLSVLFLLSILFILIGNRGYSISILLVVLWLYDNSIKKITKKNFLILSLLIIIISSIFYQMKSLTLIEKFDISQYLNIGETSPIISLLQEGSVTYRTLIYTVKYIPRVKKFQLGASYLWALSTAVPNVFGTSIHPAYLYYEDPSEWLRWSFSPAQASIGQGFGFSLIGEAYFNYGFIGVLIISFLLGYIVSRLSELSLTNEFGFNKVMFSIMLVNLLWGVRNSASSIVRDIIWQSLIVVIVTLFIKMISKNEKSF